MPLQQQLERETKVAMAPLPVFLISLLLVVAVVELTAAVLITVDLVALVVVEMVRTEQQLVAQHLR